MVKGTRFSFLTWVILGLVLLGCSAEPTPVASTAIPVDTPASVPQADTAVPPTPVPPTDTPLPTPTANPPTDTPLPTATPVAPPTDTPLPPTPTPLPPSDTPVPKPTQIPPTDTPVPTPSPVPPTEPPPPTATTKPKPTPVPTEAPPPSGAQGCYLFQNFLGADVTVTLTAQDWQWSDNFTLSPGGENPYCLDPGRYTYTLDAPPPWGSTNGDMTVQAGDRFLFPIRGQD